MVPLFERMEGFYRLVAGLRAGLQTILRKVGSFYSWHLARMSSPRIRSATCGESFASAACRCCSCTAAGTCRKRSRSQFISRRERRHGRHDSRCKRDAHHRSRSIGPSHSSDSASVACSHLAKRTSRQPLIKGFIGVAPRLRGQTSVSGGSLARGFSHGRDAPRGSFARSPRIRRSSRGHLRRRLGAGKRGPSARANHWCKRSAPTKTRPIPPGPQRSRPPQEPIGPLLQGSPTRPGSAKIGHSGGSDRPRAVS